MKRKVSVLATLVVASCIARLAAAQGAPAPASAPEAAPAEAAPATPPPPPKGYPPPPPRAPSQGGSQQAPQGGYQYPRQYPPPPPTYYGQPQRGWGYYQPPNVIFRPFSFTIGVGPGYLHGWGPDVAGDWNISEAALSYNLFRLGFGIAPNLALWLGFEGTGANRHIPELHEHSWLRQENWLLGLQYHLVPRLYVRGGVGAGFVNETSDSVIITGGTGIATAAAIGWEFVQTPHVALALDASGSFTKYSDEYWTTAGLNLAVSFF